ncbi:DUF1566 domain-containing protein [Leptospira sp. 201903075]|uniref:Lcl C-terminal domain-containing protein n=1 Tax=Leptospira chreensis TaxID=2810035 RepID=UPI0019647ACC|nr:DUF1566 domain-containing protein [Leptospira chreensis]MBM9590440.1 DUF1566 domain-containing protein [Leptospira chreensis]
MKRYLPFLIFLLFCKLPNFNNPNDPGSQLYLETQLMGCVQNGSALCPPFRVKGLVSGLTAGNTLKIQYELGGVSDSINTNGAFDIVTRGGIFPRVFIAQQPNSLFCFITNTGTKLGDGVVGMEITCPLYKAIVDNRIVGYSRCAHGQEWSPSSGGSYVGNCTGTGTAGDQYGISLSLNFCNITPTNGCTGDIAGGDLAPPPWIGVANSDIYNACNQYNTAVKWQKTNWRVATKNELKHLVVCSTGPTSPLNDFVTCNVGYSSPTINTQIFPNFESSNVFWSSNSYPLDAIQAYALELNNGQIYSPDQDSTNQVLCVTNL